MSWRTLVSTSRYTFTKLNAFFRSPIPSSHLTRSSSSSLSQFLPLSPFSTNLHSHPQLTNPKFLSLQNDVVEDDTTNEFLSRFVWLMRKKVKEVYPNSDKQTLDGMLLLIVERVVSEMETGGLETASSRGSVSSPSGDFSEDLWQTVCEVSDKVLEDMNKERKKEKMKSFLQCDEVKEMCRFAGEVGIRGDLLRELRFKWAREQMEEHEFYEELERMRNESNSVMMIEAGKERESKSMERDGDGDGDVVEEKPKAVTLPKRRGKLRFKIYGLDLSDSKWEQVADRIHEAEKVFWPQEAKPITGKCKVITEKILSLKEDDDDDKLSTLLAEWVELLKPSRADWMSLLNRLKTQNRALYFKVAEMVLTQDSFHVNVSDYSRLIDMHAEENRVDDAERILNKMIEKGMQPDASAASALAHMYCNGGNLERAKEAFELLRRQGFQPDFKLYNSMIMTYINAGQLKTAESLIRELDMREIKPTKEILMALLRSFSKSGDVNGASRISTTMQFAGFQQDMETCALLIEAHARAGNPEQARHNFNYMIRSGHKPDDRCTASMIAAYEKANLLDQALQLLLELENDGFEPGVATYSVLLDWMGKMQLVDEAEQILGKIALLGEAPPLKVQVSLCDMYARAGMEKKALQTLGVLEARKDELVQDEFERIIRGLIDGGFWQEAQRIKGIMEARGFAASDGLTMAFMSPKHTKPNKYTAFLKKHRSG